MSNISITPQLQRDGNSQPDRDIRYRNPEEVKVDARSVLDILHFFWQYAKVVRYYDIQAGEQGDWSSFFTQSAPFQIANIAQFDAETWWSGFQKHCDQARNKAHLGATNQLVTYLFDAFAVWKNWGEGLADDKTLVAQTVLKLNETNVRSLAENFILIQNVVTQKFGLKINRDAKILLGKPWDLEET
jgi:hypothetical protein